MAKDVYCYSFVVHVSKDDLFCFVVLKLKSSDGFSLVLITYTVLLHYVVLSCLKELYTFKLITVSSVLYSILVFH